MREIDEIINLLKDVSNRLNLIESSIFGKEKAIEKIKELIKKHNYVSWEIFQNEKGTSLKINHCEKFHRLCKNLTEPDNLKTCKIGHTRIYYTNGFNIEKYRMQMNYKSLKHDDSEIMKIIHKHCKTSKDEKINIDKFISETFPQFNEKIKTDIKYGFMGLCEHNKWGIKPLRENNRFTDVVVKVGEGKHENTIEHC